MREILFRGKRTDNGEWCYGHLYKNYFGDWVIVNEKSRLIVNDKTVGQYTGLTDKNGKKIFESDIVNYNGSCHKIVFESRNGTGYFGIVVGKNETWGFGNSTPAYMMAVVGNIHDNADLLGENNAKEQ